MLRSGSVVLGAGLLFLWIIGLTNHATAWMTWLDGLSALCAFAIAASASGKRPVFRPSVASMVLSGGLFIMWMAGIAVQSTRWLRGWTCAFACAFLLLGAFGEEEGERHEPCPPQQSIG
jgi:hypothetical protein